MALKDSITNSNCYVAVIFHSLFMKLNPVLAKLGRNSFSGITILNHCKIKNGNGQFQYCSLFGLPKIFLFRLLLIIQHKVQSIVGEILKNFANTEINRR